MTGRHRTRLRAAALTVAIAAVTLGLTISASQAASTDAAADKPKPTHTQIQLLALNDFHGNLAPNSPTSSSGNINGTPAGGAEYLATHLKQLRAAAKANGQESVTVAAGDLIGASPLLSAAFHDEPTIEALSRDGPGRHLGRQPRVRRGLARAAPDAAPAAACPTVTARTTRTPARTRRTRSTAPSSSTCPRTCSSRTPTGRCCRRTRSRPSRAARRSASSV